MAVVDTLSALNSNSSDFRISTDDSQIAWLQMILILVSEESQKVDDLT